jgi:hypothetical protein
MLVMGSKTLTVEGVTVFADHADPRQFWYLPAPVALAGRDGVPQFTLIRYRPAVADAGVQGGGFLMMEVELRLDPGVEQKILSAVSRFSDGTPRLTPVPFDDGTVQVVALNIQGGGGTNAPAPPAGAFVAVESILGATKPSLAGNNSAVFSLTLSQEGSIILDQAFREGATPVGIIYDLKYTALRPALDVKITANFKRIYDHLNFSVDLTAGAVIYGVPVYLEAGIDMAFEKLKQDGVITVEVINFTNSADEADKEKWALDFFKQNLLQQWFQPTLAPVTFDRKPPTGGTPGTGGTPATGGTSSGGASSGSGTSAGGGASAGGGTSAGGASSGAGASGRGGASSGGASSGGAASGGASSGGAASGGAASGGASSGGASSGGAASGGAASGGAASGGASGGGAASGGGSPAGPGGERPESLAAPSLRVTREVWAYPFLETVRQPVRLERTVDPDTPGYDIQMTQQAESDQVTLMFLGGTAVPTVRVDGVQQDLSDARQLTLTVAAGASPLNVEALYPAAAAGAEEFRLYFDFDKPRAPGWSISPPSPAFSGYLSNRTNPLDSRYQISTGPAGAPEGTPTGADALRAWLRSAIGSPRRVTVEAYASFEGDDSTASLNQQLTQRRADVAVGIIGSDADVTSVNPAGFTVARTAGRVGSQDDRYALVRGVSAGGRPVTIRGTLSRAAAPTGTGSGGGTSGGTGTGGTGSGTSGTGGTGGGTGTGTGAAGTGTSGGTGSGGATGTGSGTPATGGTAATGGGAAGGAAKPALPQTPPMGVKLAFRLQKIEQIEDKTVTLHYTRQSAEQRSYAPQGLIGLLADDLDGPPHFIEVDLDSPFFRELDIEVEAPAAFDTIGLLRADVAIEYGRAADPVGVKHKDISFRPAGSRVEKASFFLNAKRDLNYTLGLQYHFSPLAGWDGEKLSYELPTVSSLDRTLLINAFRDFGFFEIKVVPGDIDRDMVDSTDVQLHYDHPGRWSRDKVITVRPDSAVQGWKLRLSDPQQQTFTYKLTHRLKDGTTRDTEPVTTNVPLIAVNDPYDEPLIIELFPNYDTASIRLLIVDLTYDDPASTKPRVQQVRFQPADTASKRVRFARTDPSIGRYSIQLTILGNDNSVRRLRPVFLTDSVVFLGEQMGREILSRR